MKERGDKADKALCFLASVLRPVRLGCEVLKGHMPNQEGLAGLHALHQGLPSKNRLEDIQPLHRGRLDAISDSTTWTDRNRVREKGRDMRYFATSNFIANMTKLSSLMVIPGMIMSIFDALRNLCQRVFSSALKSWSILLLTRLARKVHISNEFLIHRRSRWSGLSQLAYDD